MRLLYSRLAIIVLLVPVFFFGYAAYNAYGKSTEAEVKRLAVEEELARVTERENVLLADLEVLESSRGVEEALRSRYLVGREGEQVIMLIDNELEPVASPVYVPPPSLWARVISIVF